ncbi:MAG: DUF2891 family protein [Magnetococcales bacterium]|nr:DUF2891 family protein [Magnetococcales bacterium]NGZ26993.1 DUF2891 family protein [Magnetococcales bacterium]
MSDQPDRSDEDWRESGDVLPTLLYGRRKDAYGETGGLPNTIDPCQRSEGELKMKWGLVRFWLLIWFLFALPPALGRTTEEDRQALSQLALVVEECVFLQETTHPVFHGCVDWHSAVHGHWALLRVAHLQKKDALAKRVLSRLNPAGMAQEEAWIRRQDREGNQFEMPYGRAWFLQLARDAETLHGVNTLRPLADYLFQSLLVYARQHGGTLEDSRYNNASWYLYQAHQWTLFTGQPEARREIENIVHKRMVSVPRWPRFGEEQGFFDPKAMALLLLSSTGPQQGVWDKLLVDLRRDGLQPLSWPVASAHQGGINYSRSWGLSAAVRVTGDQALARARDEHLAIMLDQLPQWRRDYRRFSHWVAQFGILALVLAQEAVEPTLDGGKNGATKGNATTDFR